MVRRSSPRQEYGAPVRRFQMVAMVLAMAAAAAGCGGDGNDGSESAGSTSSTVAAPAVTTVVPSPAGGTTVPPIDLTLRITDVRLVNSEESDSGMRVLLPAGVASASVTVTGLPTPNRVISVCQARELDRRLNVAVCRTPTSGEAVTVALGEAALGVEIVQVGVAGTGPAANSIALEEVTIRYAASSREVTARLPQIAAGESGGSPTFALTPPAAAGTYRATLSWTVIPVFGGTDSRAQIELLQAGAATQSQSGGSGVELSGNVPAPVGDAAIRLRSIGSAALVTPTLTASLP